jgi:hypothetical protein
VFFFSFLRIENLVKFNPKKEILVEFTLEKQIFQNFVNLFFKNWRNLARETNAGPKF